MAHFLCANCSWQGNGGVCPLCGEITESLHVEEYSGLPLHHELEFATQEVEDVDFESDEDL